MDEFSFDPSGALKPSAFKRLLAVRVQAPSRDPAFDSQPSPPQGQARIFREVPPTDLREQASLSGLESVVTNLSESAASVERIAEGLSGEVGDVNADSAGASVTEVESAVRLAEDLAVRIARDAQLGSQAQAAQLAASSVTRFLG